MLDFGNNVLSLFWPPRKARRTRSQAGPQKTFLKAIKKNCNCVPFEDLHSAKILLLMAARIPSLMVDHILVAMPSVQSWSSTCQSIPCTAHVRYTQHVLHMLCVQTVHVTCAAHVNNRPSQDTEWGRATHSSEDFHPCLHLCLCLLTDVNATLAKHGCHGTRKLLLEPANVCQHTQTMCCTCTSSPSRDWTILVSASPLYGPREEQFLLVLL